MIKAILFDYGGTLDTNGKHWASVIWNGYKNAGIVIDYDTFYQAYVYAERYLGSHQIIECGDSFVDVLNKKIKLQADFFYTNENIHISQETTIKIVAYCINLVCKNISKSKKVLSCLYQKFPMILVSNFYGNLRTVLSDYQLDYFEDIIESEHVKIRKPNPEIYQLAIKKLGLSPKEILIVGDSIKNDIQPGIFLGCKVAWLKGNQKSENISIIPDYILNDLSELITILS